MGELAKFVLRGRWQAILLAGFFGGLSLILLPFALLSAAVLALITLRRGDLEGIAVMLGAALLIWLAAQVVPARPGLEFPVVLAFFIPVWVGSRVLRRTESQGLCLTYIAGFAALFVFAMHAVTGDVVAWWDTWLRRAASGVDGATYEGFQLDGTVNLFNGMVALLFGISCMLSIMLARWWQAMLFNPGGFGIEFRALRLPKNLFYLSALVVFGSVIFSTVFVNDLVAVIIMAYFFQGLAVLHATIVKGKYGTIARIIPYIGLFLFPQYMVVGLAMAGALDAVVDFRRRHR